MYLKIYNTERFNHFKISLSMYVGLTEVSTDKPEIDEDDEESEDQWKDASPVTPICSPARKTPRFHHRDRRSPTRYIDVDNDVEIIHEFYPTTSKTMHEETSIVSYGGTIIVETTRIPRHIKQIPTKIEKIAPKVKLKKQSSLEFDRIPPVKEEPSITEEPSKITAEAVTTKSDVERPKSLKRHGSMESDGRMSTSKEILKKPDTSSEKGAKKKVLKEKEDGKKRSRKSGRRSSQIERKTGEVSSRRKSLGDEDIKRKGHDEVYRRSREERKSLKEQECIERVTEFLTKHSILTYPDMTRGLETVESEIADEQTEQRDKRPSIISTEGEIESPPTIVETSIVEFTGRKESLKGVPEATEGMKDTVKDVKVVDASRSPETRKRRLTLERSPEAISDLQQPKTEVQKPMKRPSSLRKKRDSFSKESSRESLLEEKKGVRIQENVQEIYFEDTSEQVSRLLLSKERIQLNAYCIVNQKK